jgi:8-oxo-dGTP pyrophosphatase MutT (NUDIX family)
MRRVTEPGILTAVARRLGRALTALPRPPHSIFVGDVAVGHLDDARAARLACFQDVFERRDDGALVIGARLADDAARTGALDAVVRILADEGALTAWRDERYAVAARFEDPPLFSIERAAARYFGIATYAAHANGFVPGPTGATIWFARRSDDKPIDPGRLDNLVGGGIAAGERPDHALVREAWEEAGVPARLARDAQPVAHLHVARAGPDGFHRETIFAYDLALPADFVPANQDGEAVEHRRVDPVEAMRLIAQEDGHDVVTVDASLVVLDWLDRHGHVPVGTTAAELIRAVRAGAPVPGV